MAHLDCYYCWTWESVFARHAHLWVGLSAEDRRREIVRLYWRWARGELREEVQREG